MLNLAISRLTARLVAPLEAASHALSGLYVVVQDAHAAAARFRSLAQLSDAELARRGLKREGLAQAVFAPTAEA